MRLHGSAWKVRLRSKVPEKAKITLPAVDEVAK